MAEERVQRKLAAIFVADVVGYSRLSENNEEGMLERLKQLSGEVIEPIIDEHRSRIRMLPFNGWFRPTAP